MQLSMKDIPSEGIEHVSAADFAYAKDFGFTIKLLATARLHEGSIQLSVRPTLVPHGTPLSTIRGAFNAVEVRSYALGPALFVGQGAGALPTGSAVVSDIIEAGRNLVSKTIGRVPHLAWIGGVQAVKLSAVGSRTGRWDLRFSVADEPGVPGSDRGCARSARHQHLRARAARARRAFGFVTVVVMTHEAGEARMSDAIAALDACSFSRGPTRLLAIEREG